MDAASHYTISQVENGRWDVREHGCGGMDDPRVIATKATREEAQAIADEGNRLPRQVADVG
jgi:hypothetical protein